MSERSRPAAIQFARPPYDAASMDFTNAARAGRSSLSILSSPIFESIGTIKKIATMMTGDSTGTDGWPRTTMRSATSHATSFRRTRDAICSPEPCHISKLIKALRKDPARTMSAYLLTCSCGKTVPVDLGQAGGQVSCSCGTQLDVPTLRQLRHLPRAAEPENPRSRGVWGARQGIMTASLLAAAAFFAWSGYVWWTRPVMPKFDPAERMRRVESYIQTPAGAYQAWVEYYRPMAERGIPMFQVANLELVESAIIKTQYLLWTLWGITGLFILLALAAIYWPAATVRPPQRRE